MNRLLRRTAGLAASATAAALLPIALASPAGAVAPSNDDFANAISLVSGQSVIADNTGATVESGELAVWQSGSGPVYDCYGGASVWYKIPNGTSHIHIAVTAESFDDAIGVWSGDYVSPDPTDLNGYGGLRPQAASTQTSIDVDLNTTKQNFVEVDGCNVHDDNPLQARDYGTTTFTATLSTPPTNDSYANATAISGQSGTVNGDNTGATVEDSETNCDPQYYSSQHSVWYSWTAPASASYVFTTAGSSFPTEMCIGPRTSTAVGTFDPSVGIAERNVADGSARLQFNATAGTVLSIKVDGSDPTSHSNVHAGAYTLNWGLAPDTTPPNVAITSPASGSTVPVGTATLTVSAAATDNGSGVKQVVLGVSGAGEQTVSAPVGGVYTANFSLTGETAGPLTITAVATDNASNTSATVSEVVTYGGGTPAGYSGATTGAGKSPVKATGVTSSGFTTVKGLTGLKALKSSKKGAKITIRFFGKGIACHFVSFKGAGKVQLVLDGKKKLVLDLYRASAKGKDKVGKFLNLVRGKHTLVITVTGAKNPSATAAAVVMWLFSVGA